MRTALFGLAVPLCLLATAGIAQDAWEYDAAGVDGPTALVIEDGYVLGGFCVEETLYFFTDFPRDDVPKSDLGTVRLKFTSDVPPDTDTFDVSVITREWQLFGDKATVWFRGQVADDWLEDTRTARTNVYIAVETDEETPRFIFERWFPVRGSTAAIDALTAECRG